MGDVNPQVVHHEADISINAEGEEMEDGDS